MKQLSPADVGYKYGVRATFAGVDPREPDVVRAKEHALRFVILETETAYTFALASYAPRYERSTLRGEILFGVGAKTGQL